MNPSFTWAASSTLSDDDSSDDTDIATTPSASVSDGSNSLESLHNTEVVYPASKSEEKTTDAPGSTTILTSTEIKVGGFRTLDDLLNYVRGFFITYDRDYSYVGLRGLGNLGGYASRILLLIDGHRINDNIYDEFYSGEDTVVDMDTVDHVEIIRGPASVLYGSSAVFGVINVVTKKGKDVKGLTLSAQGGSLNTIGGGALYGGQTNSGFQWTLQGSYYYSGGNASLYYPEYDTPSLNVNNGIAQNCDGQNAQHAFLTMDWNDWSLESTFMHRYKNVPTGFMGIAFDNPNVYTDDYTFFSEIDYKHGDPENGQWLGRLYVDASDYTGNYPSATAGQPTNVDIGNGAWWGAELRYVLTPLSRNKVTLGGEFVDNFQQFQNNYDLGGSTYVDDNRQSTQWSLYAQDDINLISNLLLSAGGRYDYFSQSGGQFVPRGALIWDPVQTTVLKLVAGEAFRAPDDYEMYYADGYSQEANPNLKIETFETYEFDLEQSFLTNHRVLFSLYHYVGENLILGVQDPNNTDFQIYENVGHDSLNGIEMEYQYQNPGGIQGRLSWAYQRAQDDITGQVLPDSPQNLGKASFQVPIDAKHLTVAAECQFTAASYGFTGAWAPDYTIFNLKLYSPHFIWDNMEANLAFYNLFNTTYYQPVSNDFQQLTLQQDGLVIWGRLGYKL